MEVLLLQVMVQILVFGVQHHFQQFGQLVVEVVVTLDLTV
jgi:hypothetical protein